MNRNTGILAGLLSVGLLLGPPPSAASPTPLFRSLNGGRVPNKDSKQMFPRWHPYTLVDAFDDAGFPSSKLANMAGSIAVDGKNIAHIVGQDGFQNTALVDGVYYYTNDYSSRRGNGFSAAFAVFTSGPNDDASIPDIAVAPDGSLHVAWKVVFTDPVTFEVFHNLYYRKKTAAGWGTALNITNVPATTEYHAPQIAVDASGNARIAAIKLFNGTSAIVLITIPPGGGATEETVFSTTNPVLFETPRVSTDSASFPHVVWRYCDQIALTETVRYSRRTAGGWTAPVIVSDSDDAIDPDLFVDKTDGDTPHFAWLLSPTTPPASVRYRKGTGGTMETVSSQPVTPTLFAHVRLVVDTLHQPHVVWHDGNVSSPHSYAARIANADLATPWGGRQEPAEVLQGGGLGPVEIAINRNDEIYLACNDAGGNLALTRTIEHNLGDQDAFAMASVGPNASANLANGNLLSSFPLFASRGAGFATALSLLHNSQGFEPSVVSQGWLHNYHLYVTDSWSGINQIPGVGHFPDVITLFLGDGRSVVFKYRNTFPGEVFHYPEDEFGYFSKIQRLTATLITEYKMTTKFGVVYTFQTDGKLREIKDTNNNLLTLNYTNGLLTTITDTMGRTTYLTYDTSGRLQTVEDPFDPINGRTYTLAYNSSGQLSSITLNSGSADPNEKPVWQFAYHAANDGPNFKKVNLLSHVTTPRVFTHQYLYYLDNRFRASQDPPLTQPSLDEAGNPTIPQHPQQVVNYFDPASFPPPAGQPRAELTNRRGFVTKVEFEQRKSLAVKITDANNFFITREFSPDHRNLKKFYDKLGNETLYFYTHEEGTKETLLYVRDNLRRILQPAPNADPGAAASITTATYTYIPVLSRVDTLADAFGNVTDHDYDPAGNLLEIRYPNVPGQGVAVERFTYTTLGRVLTHKSPRNVDDPAGAQTTFAYVGPTGLVSSISRPDHSLPESFTYDAMGNTDIHTLPEGGVTDIDLDGLYRVMRQTAPTGDEPSVTAFAYDLDSNVDTVTGPGSAFTDHTYDELGRLIQTKTKLTATTDAFSYFHYDPEGNTRKSIDPDTRVATATFDPQNRLDIETRPGAPSPNVVTNLNYDANGNVSTRTVGISTPSTTTFTYTARNQLKTTFNSALVPAELDENVYFNDGTLDRSVHRVSGIEKNGTSHAYDARRRLVSTTQLTTFSPSYSGFTTTYTLDKNGNRTAVTDPDLRVVSFESDQADRQFRTRDHFSTVVSETIYDNNDRRTTVKAPHPETGLLVVASTLTYNARNELKTETDIFGNQTTFKYDSRGNLLERELPAVGGIVCKTVFEFDFASRMTKETRDPGVNQIVWQYGYSASGDRTTITDPRNFVYTHVYDASHRLNTLTYPPVGAQTFVETWLYNERGNMETHLDPDGKTATMTHDALDRPDTEIHVKNAVTLASLDRNYDSSGNLLSYTDSVSQTTVSYTDDAGLPAYDALRRLKQVRWFVENSPTPWKSVKYTEYDNASNLKKLLDPEGHQFEYGYDSNGRLQTITRTPSGGGPVLIASHAYALGGQRKETNLLNGSRLLYTYDSKGRLTGLKICSSINTTLAAFEYEYDGKDRRTKLKHNHLANEITFTYDCHDRLTGENSTGNGSVSCSNNIQSLPIGNVSVYSNEACATPSAITAVPAYSATWTYDGAGNRLTKTVNGILTNYVYDDQNRLTAESGGSTVSYGYDKNGNQTLRNGGVAENFEYDYMNRLKRYQTGGTDFRYKYTPTGERLAKVNFNANTEEWFMYDGADVTADYTRNTGSQTWTLQRTYANGRAIDSKIARIEASGTTYYYVGDAIGTVHELLDSTQTVVRRVMNTAWGEDYPGFTPLLGPTERYGFSHREKDSESQLMHFRARTLDPRIGRFGQKDPILDNRATKHFVYVQNRPTMLNDPTGEYEPIEDERGRVVARILTGGEHIGLAVHNVTDKTPYVTIVVKKEQVAKWAPLITEANKWGYNYVELSLAYDASGLNHAALERMSGSAADAIKRSGGIGINFALTMVFGTQEEKWTIATAFGMAFPGSGDPSAMGNRQTPAWAWGGRGIPFRRAREIGVKTSIALAPGQPPLRRLHSDDLIIKSSRSSYEYWKKQPTQQIVESLRPGSRNALQVRPDGTVLEGNTRIKVLEERAFDINSLPRELVARQPLPGAFPDE